MKVQLTVQEWMAPPQCKIAWTTHPAYRNLRSHILSSNRYGTNKEYVHCLSNYLTSIHVRLVEGTGDSTVFEFETQEDLTQFILTWS